MKRKSTVSENYRENATWGTALVVKEMVDKANVVYAKDLVFNDVNEKYYFIVALIENLELELTNGQCKEMAEDLARWVPNPDARATFSVPINDFGGSDDR